MMATKNNEQTRTELLKNAKKYPDFVTEQSSNIEYSLVCEAQKIISQIKPRSVYILELDKYIGNRKTSMEIEAGVFEYILIYITTQNFSHKLIGSIYDYTIQSIIKTIELNKDLLIDIEQNRIKPRMIAFMSPSQLYPKNWEELLTKKRIKEEKENNLPTTDLYKCSKCGERKCTISHLQTRGSDEPMTTFIRCCICYKTWTN